MARKKGPPTREQFTDEEWAAFGRMCETIKRINLKTRLAKASEVRA